jgi:hypothetical protein
MVFSTMQHAPMGTDLRPLLEVLFRSEGSVQMDASAAEDGAQADPVLEEGDAQLAPVRGWGGAQADPVDDGGAMDCAQITLHRFLSVDVIAKGLNDWFEYVYRTKKVAITSPKAGVLVARWRGNPQASSTQEEAESGISTSQVVRKLYDWFEFAYRITEVNITSPVAGVVVMRLGSLDGTQENCGAPCVGHAQAGPVPGLWRKERTCIMCGGSVDSRSFTKFLFDEVVEDCLVTAFLCTYCSEQLPSSCEKYVAVDANFERDVQELIPRMREEVLGLVRQRMLKTARLALNQEMVVPATGRRASGSSV